VEDIKKHKAYEKKYKEIFSDTKPTVLYGAYGSNMNVEQMYIRCPFCELIGTGFIYDYQLVFNYHANIEKAKGKKVPIVLWKVSEYDINRLDRYEGFPNYYIKKNFQVITEDGEIITAMVYVMTKLKAGKGKRQFPNTSYIETIYDGYVDNGINVEYLADALGFKD
jgi:hypothetical protein